MAKLDVKAFGLACGSLWGGATLVMGILDTVSTWGDAWGQMVASIYLGYRPTIIGSVIGAAWAFLIAWIAGMIIARLYNKFAKA